MLPTGADDELQNNELQNDLPAEVADRSSCRDRQRHSRNAWTSQFHARNARLTTHVDSWRALYCRLQALILVL